MNRHAALMVLLLCIGLLCRTRRKEFRKVERYTRIRFAAHQIRARLQRATVRFHRRSPGAERQRRLQSLALLLAAAGFLFIPLKPVAGAPSAGSGSDAIVGTWQWANGAVTGISEDRTFSGQSVQGAVSGKWKPVNPAKRQYKLLWRSSGGMNDLDTVTVSADGRSLSGQDAAGKAVSARRREGGSQTGTPNSPGTTTQPGTTSQGEPGYGPGPGIAGTPDFSFHFALRNQELVLASSIVTNPLAKVMQLRAGDRVLKINDKSTDGMSVEDAEALVNGSDAPTLQVLRSSDNTRITFTAPPVRGGPSSTNGAGAGSSNGSTTQR